MAEYAELVKRLKESDDNCNAECYECSGECLSSGCNIFSEAADAIEELLARDVVPTDFHERCLQLEIRKRIELEKQMPKWISVEERLPEDFQKVLVFWWEHGEPMIDTAFWQKDAKRFDGEHWVRMEDKVTHWMPLPAPPKGGNHDN